jgi:hypothetical protein
MRIAALAAERDITQIPTISADRADAFFTVSAIMAGGFLLWALFELVFRRSPILAFCLLGSVLCNLNEPIWDALGKLRFHEGNHIAWTQFPDLAQPVHYPYWAMFVYTGFGGVACFVFYKAFASRSWKIFGYAVLGQAVMNIILEGFIITSAYDYYGEQPWRIGTDFPLWWVPVNYGEMLAGFLLCIAIRHWGLLKGGLTSIALVPCCFSAWQLWAGWPTYATINMDVHGAWRSLAALSGVGIAAGSAYLMGKVLLDPPATATTPAPAQQRERETVPA